MKLNTWKSYDLHSMRIVGARSEIGVCYTEHHSQNYILMTGEKQCTPPQIIYWSEPEQAPH